MTDIVIAGHRIKPGEEARLNINIARLPSHTSIDVVVHVNRSGKEGPTVLFSGGLHGDEINGIEIVRRILDRGVNQPLKGTVICIPIINIYGFINFSRYVPDGKDINRSFPGSKEGSLASRVAHFLSHQIMPIIDVGIDFHTGGASRTNFPQVRCNFKDEKTVELARALNAPFIVHSHYIGKSLRATASKQKKPLLVYEGGESMRIDELAVEEGVKCARNFLTHLQMDHGEKPEPSSILLKETSWVRSKYSGIFQSAVEAGQIISKKDLLGHVTDPFGEFQKTIKSPWNGYVIGLNNTPIVHQGDALLNLGKE